MHIIIDCDGVLTDGKVYYSEFGERQKAFHSRDITAIKSLIDQGYKVIILTQSTWVGLQHFAKRCGAEVAVADDKFEWLCENDIEEYIAIGDDVGDVNMIEYAKHAFCPSDAHPLLRIMKFSKQIQLLPTPGGGGCVAEVAYLLSRPKIEFANH